MIEKPMYVKHYSSAKKRFIQQSVEQFLEVECPRTFGPLLRTKLSERIVALVQKQMPHKDVLTPGQVLWNAVARDSHPASQNLKLVPVILTLVHPSDIDELSKGITMVTISKKAIARVLKEAYQQGALLTMRDIGLLTWQTNSAISRKRIEWEEENETILPHPGSLQDFGSCVTHKAIIIKKIIVDKKDPITVAYETNHSQRAVDRYLKNYYRVKTSYEHNNDIDFVTQVTGLSKSLVCQYIEIINNSSV